MSAGRRDQRTPGSPPVRTRRCATLPTWRRRWRGDRCCRRSSASPASHGNLLPW